MSPEQHRKEKETPKKTLEEFQEEVSPKKEVVENSSLEEEFFENIINDDYKGISD